MNWLKNDGGININVFLGNDGVKVFLKFPVIIDLVIGNIF